MIRHDRMLGMRVFRVYHHSIRQADRRASRGRPYLE